MSIGDIDVHRWYWYNLFKWQIITSTEQKILQPSGKEWLEARPELIKVKFWNNLDIIKSIYDFC